MSSLIEDKIKTAVTQEIVTKQAATMKGKNIVINCPVMINGNDAIEMACASDGNVIAAMKHILSVLPEPRIYWLKALAAVAGLDIAGGKRLAGKYLSVDYNVFNDPRYKNSIKAIQNGEVTFGQD